jgi:nucleoside-diphosphate-sugar epimerase
MGLLNMTEPSVDPGPESLLLVTGATGLVGSHVVERAILEGIPVRVLIRSNSDDAFLRTLPVEVVAGNLTDPASLDAAVQGVTHVVHCAAKVGDWGPVEEYRRVNVEGLRSLLGALIRNGRLRQFVHISSLGVYAASDHYGTDETEPINLSGIDGYTRSKAESEQLLMQWVREGQGTALAIRPGWIYGPRDRTVMPRLLENLKKRKVVYIGSGEQLLNQVYVENLVDAIFLALKRPDLSGQVFNVTDGRLVSRIEFLGTICELAGWPEPARHVPYSMARSLAAILEASYRFLGKKNPPLLSQARVKFLGLNLDYCIDKAMQELGYRPRFDFREGMERTIEWARTAGLVGLENLSQKNLPHSSGRARQDLR